MVKRIVGHTAVAAMMAALAIPATTMAQSANTPPGAGEGSAHFDCAAGSFNFGAGANSFNTCVSSHGNVARFNFQGSEVIANGTPAEGYILCAVVGGVGKVYHDVMWTESGWGAAVITTPGALPITVTRTTTDGAFTLEQKYSKDNAERDFTILMKLRANVPATTVKLVRTVDVDVDQNLTGSFSDVFDRSLDSVWGRQIRAFAATALTYGISHSTSIAAFPTACDNPGGGVPVTGDFGATLQYNLGNLAAGKVKLVKVGYRGM